MRVNWTGGISLLGSRSFYTLVVSLVFMVMAVFASKPEKDWAGVKTPDGVIHYDVDPEKPNTWPPGAVLYEGKTPRELQKEVWAEKLFTLGSLLSGLLTAIFIKKDPNITSYLPRADPSRVPSVFWVAGVGLMFVVGCSNAERAEYAAYRDADFNGTSVMRTEQESNSKVIAGDTNFDGVVSPEEASVPIDLSRLPNLNPLTIERRNAWLRLRLEELKQSRLRYENSKAQDQKDSKGRGPFSFFGSLFGGAKDEK